MPVLKIQRIGGLAGFGLPNSRIESRGEIDLNDLSESDRDQVELLFRNIGKTRKQVSSTRTRDGFIYQLSRIKNETEEVIEVPESDIPIALVNCVRDRFI